MRNGDSIDGVTKVKLHHSSIAYGHQRVFGLLSLEETPVTFKVCVLESNSRFISVNTARLCCWVNITIWSNGICLMALFPSWSFEVWCHKQRGWSSGGLKSQSSSHDVDSAKRSSGRQRNLTALAHTLGSRCTTTEAMVKGRLCPLSSLHKSN